MYNAGIQRKKYNGRERVTYNNIENLLQKKEIAKLFQLDCGIHPGLSGMDALPFVDLIEADEVDLLFISQ